MERETGFEPATSTLARSHSTTELFPPSATFKIPTRNAFVKPRRRLDPPGRVSYSRPKGGVAKWLRRRSAKPLFTGSTPVAASSPRRWPSRAADRPRQRTPPLRALSAKSNIRNGLPLASAGTHPAFPAGGQPESGVPPAEARGRGGLERRYTVRRAILSLILLLVLLARREPRRRGRRRPSNRRLLPAGPRLRHPLEPAGRVHAVPGRLRAVLRPAQRLRRGLRRHRVQPGADELRGAGRHYDYYSRTTDTSYRDYTRRRRRRDPPVAEAPGGAPRRHGPASCRRARGRKVVPYVGGGVDALFYQYEEFGDFIDFLIDPDLAIVPDHFVSEGDGVRLPRPGRPARLRQPRLRDRGRGPLPVGATTWATTSRPTSRASSTRSTSRDGRSRWACTCGSDATRAS